jgi:glycosyltransferase involved in cell wall biosynthesis
MRILWVSNSPHVGTGYGVQTRLFVPRLQALGHEMAIHDFYGGEGGMREWNGIPLYPKAAHPYGQDIIPHWARHFNADIVITLIDAWVYNPAEWGDVRWVPWFPVDTHPLDGLVKKAVSNAFARINFSQHGVAMTEAAGLDTLYVPHGIETGVYKPRSQAECRKNLGWKNDTFVFGMVAANKGWPPRKCFPQVLDAFAKFREEHKDALLYLHSAMDTRFGGHDLAGHVRMLEIENFVLFQDPVLSWLNFPDDYMVTLYNAIDCLLSPSMGEGFGVPILEAQSCGIPVITGDWTAMSEITFSGKCIAKEDAESHWTPHLATQFVPHVDAIVEAMEWAYQRRGSPTWQESAREGALSYDADRVTQEYWKPALETIEAKLGRSHALQQKFREAVQV